MILGKSFIERHIKGTFTKDRKVVPNHSIPVEIMDAETKGAILVIPQMADKPSGNVRVAQRTTIRVRRN